MTKRKKIFEKKTKKILDAVTGKLSVNRRGFGFVTPDDGTKDIFILQENLRGALDGDKVKVQITKNFFGDFKREGKVVEILNRARDIFIGVVKSYKKNFYVEVEDFNLLVTLQKKNLSNLKDLRRKKLKVVVKIISWENFVGEILEVISDAKNSDISEILFAHGVFENFPEKVIEESKNFTEPDANEIARRTDRRDLKIVTIDGEDAKDLDDGVFAKKIDSGFFLGVYIADVSFYVRPKTFLDKEAQERGTSIYPVDRVVPMLPKNLSNNLCSLNAGKNRLAFACEMYLDFAGNVTDYKIFPTVIKVFRRLNYAEVNNFFDGKITLDCEENLLVLKEIYELRKKIRTARGAIDFDLPEIKVKLDDDFKPVEIVKKNRGLSEGIIEECMLLANETVAAHTLKNKIPSLYRVHEMPTEEKIFTLNQLLAHFNLHISASKDKKIQPKDFQNVLEKIKNSPAEKIISTFTLRTMQQARYSAENLGHFGLAAEFYTHFTSPIRRYPDLIVHRMLRTSLENPQEISKLEKNLEELAKKSSERERRAVDIERETLDLKSVEFMQKFVGKIFNATISSVTNFGFFAELKNGVEGLIHVETLHDDFYNYIENEFALIGRRKGKSFHIGDKIRVKIVDANLKLRQLTFELVEGVVDENLIAEM